MKLAEENIPRPGEKISPSLEKQKLCRTVLVTESKVKKMKELVDDFLPKPLSYKDILRTVRKTLKKAEK